MEHAERETRAAPPAAARASRVRDAGARSALQARFDESPRVRALQAKAGSPAVQRMVIKVGTVDDGIREDAANISKAGGGAEVSQWSAVAQLGNGETLHVVGHLEEGTMDGKDAAALAAEVAPHLQGKTDVTVDLHGCFAANPGALEAEADDLWASYAGKFQKALAGLLGSNVPVVASLGAEYTSSGGETRVREGSYVKQDVDDAVKLESGRLVGPGTKPGLAHARAATDAVIEGTRSEGLFLRQGEGRLVFKDAKTDAIDKGDGGALEDLEGAWDPRAYRIQAKLEVGAADDAYEREADRMARHAIARMYAPQAAHEDADVTPAGDGVQMKATPLRRHGGAEAFDAPDHVESAIGSARGSGSPLPEALRAPLESSLGADFSGVRVHSDARAHALNQSIQAKAFTTGQDVFFRQGAYQPGSRSGQELLAHELTHVVQQGGADVARRPEEERIQRMPAWRKAPEAPDGKYDAFVIALDRLVNDNAAAVLAHPLSVPQLDGYLRRWVTVATSFAETVQQKGSVGAGLVAEPFLYASFGYAVESLTNAEIAAGQLKGDLPVDASVTTQATRGHTRPDLVVKDAGGEVGWFDITASASETHIQDKTGSGWSTRPYVAEVTYPSLSLEDLLKLSEATLTAAKGLDSTQLEELRKRVEQHRQRQAEQRAVAIALVEKALEAVGGIGDRAQRRKGFEEAVASLLARVGKGEGESKTEDASAEATVPKVTPGVAKGLLSYLWPYTEHYGSYAKIALAAGYKNETARNPETEKAKELIFG